VCIGVDPDPAGRYRTATFAETVAAVHGVYRVALTPESVPYDFLALADLTGMSARERQAWQSTARDKGANPADWWGTLSPVGRDEWLDVQRWDAARCDWVSVEIHAEVQRLIEAGLRLGLPSAAFQQELTAHYLGQQVIVGQTWDAMLADSHEGRYYILGTLDPEHPTLPDHVLAIIADDQHEAVDEYLSLWTVEEKGSIVTATPHPLIVLDTQERCVYGLELLQAILDTGKTVPAVIIRGVVLPER
jgi:hypothetical protein